MTTFDPSTLLCNACSAKLETWLAAGTGEVTPEEFLNAFLVLHGGPNYDPHFETFFCGRCTARLYGWIEKQAHDDGR